jgi:hypothetical protein
MKKLTLAVAAFAVFAAAPAYAAEFKCNGDSVEKSGSTHYKVRTSARTSPSRSPAAPRARRSERQQVHRRGLGQHQGHHRGRQDLQVGSTWASVSDAQRKYDCPTPRRHALGARPDRRAVAPKRTGSPLRSWFLGLLATRGGLVVRRRQDALLWPRRTPPPCVRG